MKPSERIEELLDELHRLYRRDNFLPAESNGTRALLLAQALVKYLDEQHDSERNHGP